MQGQAEEQKQAMEQNKQKFKDKQRNKKIEVKKINELDISSESNRFDHLFVPNI